MVIIKTTEIKCSINQMNMNGRLKNVLLRNGIEYLSQLEYYSWEEIASFHGLGEKSMKELADVCRACGVKMWSTDELTKAFERVRIQPCILGNIYRAGIRTVEELAKCSWEEIEVFWEGDTRQAKRILRIVKNMNKE